MSDAIQHALTIAPNAPPAERTIDITTYGARTGEPRRIEIWFHHVDGRWFLTGRPGRRAWYANLLKDPRLLVHLKHGVVADLDATATPITDPAQRRRDLGLILGGLDAMGGTWSTSSADLERWVADAPLVELHFAGDAAA